MIVYYNLNKNYPYLNYMSLSYEGYNYIPNNNNNQNNINHYRSEILIKNGEKRR